MKFFRLNLWIQTTYYLLTAIWPLVDINSFMVVSGPKTDIWLVKTVAALLLAICCGFLAGLFLKGNKLQTIILAMASCLGLILIDCYYALNGTISKIYLLDAGIQAVFLLAWVILLFNRKNRDDLYRFDA